jgi:hypothetical protein
MGIYDAMNRGLARARGEWVLFLNGGDFLYGSQTLECLSALLRDIQGPWTYGTLAVQMADKSWQLRSSKVNIAKAYWAKDWFPHPSIVARRSFLSEVGGYSISWKISADQEWALRLHSSYDCVPIPLTISCLTYGGLSASNSLWHRELEFCRIRHAHEKLLLRSKAVDQLATFALFLWRCVKLRMLGGSRKEPLRNCF